VQHLFADCAADPGCHQDFPNLQAEFETVVKRLDQAPAKFQFPGPSGKPQEITLSRGAFVSDLRPLLYQPGIVSQLPLILHHAHENDWKPFASVVLAMHRAVADSVARGMSFSVSCAESVPFITEADVRRETNGTYLGDYDVRVYQRGCQSWPHAQVPKNFLAPVRSNVPSLLISGAEDPATPPWLAQHAAEHLTQSRVVSIPYGTHLTDAACIDRILVQFVNAGAAAGLDVECVNQIRNPPFARLGGR
jgi:pimeloyl-ACP methyl ester carboxylesterase